MRAFVRAKYSPNNPPHSCRCPPDHHPTHPHLHHHVPEVTTSGVVSKIAEARLHSHLKWLRQHATNNHPGGQKTTCSPAYDHLGSPKAPNHLRGCHHSPGHVSGDANCVTEHHQQATTCDGTPTTATACHSGMPPYPTTGEWARCPGTSTQRCAQARDAVSMPRTHNKRPVVTFAITGRPDDAQGGVLCPPSPSAGQHSNIVQKCTTLSQRMCTTNTAIARARNHDTATSHAATTMTTQGALCAPHHLSLLGYTLASCRSVQCGIGTHMPHTPATTTTIAIACGHTKARGASCASCTPTPLLAGKHPSVMQKCMMLGQHMRAMHTSSRRCDRNCVQPHNNPGVPAAPPPGAPVSCTST
jgi:hypothetical protein